MIYSNSFMPIHFKIIKPLVENRIKRLGASSKLVNSNACSVFALAPKIEANFNHRATFIVRSPHRFGAKSMLLIPKSHRSVTTYQVRRTVPARARACALRFLRKLVSIDTALRSRRPGRARVMTSARLAPSKEHRQHMIYAQ